LAALADAKVCFSHARLAAARSACSASASGVRPLLSLLPTMWSGERDAVQRPGEVFPEFGEPGFLRLALHRDGLAPEAPALGKEHRPQLFQALERVDLARLEQMAVGPVVVSGREDERMHRGLEGGKDALEALVGARHRDPVGAPFVRSRVRFEIADVNDEFEVLLVHRREHALELLLALPGIARVANGGELERPGLAERKLACAD
jgi:hypothetical protein